MYLYTDKDGKRPYGLEEIRKLMGHASVLTT